MTDLIQVSSLTTESLDGPENGQASKKAKHRLRLKQQRRCPQLSTRFICPFIRSLPCGSSKFTVLAAMQGDDVDVINLTGDVTDFGKYRKWAGLFSIRFDPLGAINFSPVDEDSPSLSPRGPACLDFTTRFMDVTFGPKDVKRANEKWNCHYPETPFSSPQKVTFCSDLVSVFSFEDDEESRTARIGTWACDGQRFQMKIQDISNVLSPILCRHHRQSVYDRLYSSSNTS